MKTLLLLTVLLVGCDSSSFAPASLAEAGPGSPECRRLETYILRPGNEFGTQRFRSAERNFFEHCLVSRGGSEKQQPDEADPQ